MSELLALCREAYEEWTEALLGDFDPGDPPRLISPHLYFKLRDRAGVPVLLDFDKPLKEQVEALSTVSERNAFREEVIRNVWGDPLGEIAEDKVRRRIRSVLFDLLCSFQAVLNESAQASIDSFEADFAPRAWHYIKDCVLRGLYDVSHITHLDTEKGGKITSVSPRELAYAIELVRT